MQRTKVPLLPKHRLPAGARECRRERESLEDDAPTAADEAGAPTTAADHETAAAVEAIAMGDRRAPVAKDARARGRLFHICTSDSSRTFGYE